MIRNSAQMDRNAEEVSYQAIGVELVILTRAITFGGSERPKQLNLDAFVKIDEATGVGQVVITKAISFGQGEYPMITKFETIITNYITDVLIVDVLVNGTNNNSQLPSMREIAAAKLIVYASANEEEFVGLFTISGDLEAHKRPEDMLQCPECSKDVTSNSHMLNFTFDVLKRIRHGERKKYEEHTTEQLVEVCMVEVPKSSKDKGKRNVYQFYDHKDESFYDKVGAGNNKREAARMDAHVTEYSGRIHSLAFLDSKIKKMKKLFEDRHNVVVKCLEINEQMYYDSTLALAIEKCIIENMFALKDEIPFDF
uniref:ThiF domain-containing protein n=1 Tax=Rhabditophanes sp. KR3021 TaxID=114890 RepID=A0AC35UFE3_9BILA